jgi:hypothetical protein
MRINCGTWMVLMVGALLNSGSMAQEKKPPDLTTDLAASDPDFKVQGEYDSGGYGAQVVAKGDGKFEVYLLEGGLPGVAKEIRTRRKFAATTKDGSVTFSGNGWKGDITNGVLTATIKAESLTLKRVERKSPTLGEKPPANAVVLFDGKNADEWDKGAIVDSNLLFCGTTSKKGFGVGKLHIEFRTPYQPKAGGQGRGNSGVFVLGKEIQVLDSFGLEGKSDECGAFYGSKKPSVNMCLPPLTWQTYDVEIKADEKGDLRATVLHNGVKVHEDYPIAKKGAKPTGIHLQNHGNPVVYRNIWIVTEK